MTRIPLTTTLSGSLPFLLNFHSGLFHLVTGLQVKYLSTVQVDLPHGVLFCTERVPTASPRTNLGHSICLYCFEFRCCRFEWYLERLMGSFNLSSAPANTSSDGEIYGLLRCDSPYACPGLLTRWVVSLRSKYETYLAIDRGEATTVRCTFWAKSSHSHAFQTLKDDKSERVCLPLARVLIPPHNNDGIFCRSACVFRFDHANFGRRVPPFFFSLASV